VINRDTENWTFRVYVTDTLQTISENTAIPASVFTGGEHGKAIPSRWADRNKPDPPAETSTQEEVIAYMKEKLASL